MENYEHMKERLHWGAFGRGVGYMEGSKEGG